MQFAKWVDDNADRFGEGCFEEPEWLWEAFWEEGACEHTHRCVLGSHLAVCTRDGQPWFQGGGHGNVCTWAFGDAYGGHGQDMSLRFVRAA